MFLYHFLFQKEYSKIKKLMLKLSFPNYEFRLKKINQKKFIFDEIRKKYIELTPEEWVRQHCIRFLVTEKKFKRGLISVEEKN